MYTKANNVLPKSLIVKTFGMSHLVNALQVLEIRPAYIIRTEISNFGFVWIGAKSENERGIDRIKRAVLINRYDEGGLNLTDVD